MQSDPRDPEATVDDKHQDGWHAGGDGGAEQGDVEAVAAQQARGHAAGGIVGLLAPRAVGVALLAAEVWGWRVYNG